MVAILSQTEWAETFQEKYSQWHWDGAGGRSDGRQQHWCRSESCRGSKRSDRALLKSSSGPPSCNSYLNKKKTHIDTYTHKHRYLNKVQASWRPFLNYQHLQQSEYYISFCYGVFNTLRLRQNGCHFADDFSKCIFFHEKVWILNVISLKFVPIGPINNMPTLV